MSAGRCPGCGLTDPSCKRVRNHMRECPECAELLRAGRPILDPEDEYRRYREWLKSPESMALRDEEHARTYRASRDASEALQARQRAKWTGS